MHRHAWVVVLLYGCHTVIAHNPGASDGARDCAGERARIDAASDGPRSETRPQDGPRPADGSTEARADAPRADAPRADAQKADAQKADGAPDLPGPVSDGAPAPDAPPPLVTGAPCGDGTTSPGCCMKGAASEWCWEHPLPQGNHLRAVFALAPDDVTIVGEHGTILHLYKGTFYREATSPPTTATLTGVWGHPSPRTLFAVSTSGEVFRRDAGSATWQSETGAQAYLRAIFGLSPSEIYAVGNGGAIFRRDPASQKWVKQSWGIPTSSTLQAIWGTGSTLYVGGFETAEARLWRRELATSSTAKEEINAVSATGATSVASIAGDGNTIVIVGQNLIKTRAMTGVAWADTPTQLALSSVWHDGTEFWVASGSGLRRLSALASAQAAGAELHALGGSGATGIAVGYRGAIWQKNGSTWLPKSTRVTTAALTSVWGTSGSDLWAASSGGEILRFDGSAWSVHHSYQGTLQGNLAYAALSGYAAVTNGKVVTKLAVGASQGGALYRSTRLLDLTLPPSFATASTDLTGVWVVSENKAYATAASGTEPGIHVWSGSAPSSWSLAKGSSALYGIWGFPSGEVVAVGASEACVNAPLAGWTCKAHGAGAPLRALWGRTLAGSTKVAVAVGDDRIAHAEVPLLNWSALPLSGRMLRAVWGRGNDLFAVGEQGVALSGAHVSLSAEEKSGTNLDLNGVWLPAAIPPTGSRDVRAVGDHGAILCRLAP